MAKHEDLFEASLIERNIITIKRVTIASLVILVLILGFPLVGTWMFGSQAKQEEERRAYIERRTDKVSNLLKDDKHLKLERIAFGVAGQELESKGSRQYRLNVVVIVDSSKAVAEFKTRAGDLKKEIDKILTHPPLDARVRLVLRSEEVRE